MKNKKILKSICALVAAATLGVTSLAGCNKCEHAYTWTTEKAATCINDGQERGVCGLCGDVVTRTIEKSADAHVYGEWQIDYPTESAAGTATKICSENTAHVLTVELPALTAAGTGYTASEITKPATAVSEGVQHLELDHAAGKIVFDAPLARLPLTTVKDAVLLAYSLGSLVRSSHGTYSESIDGIKNEFSYDFGDDYTHVYQSATSKPGEDAISTEYWYSLDDAGEPFGVFVENYYEYETTPDAGNTQPTTPGAGEGESGETAPGTGEGESGETTPDAGESESTGSTQPSEDVGEGTLTTTDPRVVENVTESNLKGFYYASGSDITTFCGAEEGLKQIYETSEELREAGTCVGYKEEISRANDGKVTASFSFSYLEGSIFCRYYVDFTLHPEGVIDTMKVQTNIIRMYMIAEDAAGNKLFKEDGDVIFAEEYARDPNTAADLYEMDGDEIVYDGVKTDADGNELKDKNGNTIPRPKAKVNSTYNPQDVSERKYYSDDHHEVSVRTITFEGQTLKKDTDEVKPNKYDSSVLYIKSFEVTRNNQKLEHTGTTLPSNVAVALGFDELAPTTATLDYDPMRVYIRTATRDIELTSEWTDNAYKIMGFFNKSSKTYTINARYAGEVTLVFKPYGGQCEKVYTVNFEKSTPTSIGAQANVYSNAGGVETYSWREVTTALPVTLYVGEPVIVRAVAPEDEMSFADVSASCLCSVDGLTIEKLPDGTTRITPRTLPPSEPNGTPVDTYTVYIKYDAAEVTQSGVNFTTFGIKVLPAPKLTDLLQGEYEGRAYFKLDGTQTQLKDVKATFSYVNDWTQGSVRLDVGSEGDHAQYTYVYDESTHKFTLTYTSGLKGETLDDIEFAINEHYDITLTHKKGFGNEKETVLLLPVAEEQPSQS